RVVVLLIQLFTAVISATAYGASTIGRGPRLVDSTGKPIGSLVGDLTGNTGSVLRRLSGGLGIRLRVNSTSFEHDSAVYLHEAADCSGPRLLPTGTAALAQWYVDTYPTNTIGVPQTGIPNLAFYPSAVGQDHVTLAREGPTNSSGFDNPACVP